ncbi:MAG TPA: FkbM family methyltransferase [Blastocatellia bacterium]|nr:FkbM family methyltransferase [Blastocatellia bacterium]
MPQQIDRLKDYVQCAQALGSTPKDAFLIFWKETKNIRARLKMEPYRPDKVYTLQTIYGRFYFRDNFGDITNLVGLIHLNVYRVGRLEHEGVILDIGANIGLAAAWFAYHNPGRAIYCFEPLAENTALIRKNCPTAIIEEVAVGLGSGRVTLLVDRDSVMASSIPCNWDTHSREFDTVSLDEFARERAIKQVALMKIDVEGMELEVLRGGPRTLGLTHRVVMETHGRSLHDEAMSLLRSASFSIQSEQFDSKTGLVFASH